MYANVRMSVAIGLQLELTALQATEGVHAADVSPCQAWLCVL
jgi:hypothetical protein